MIKQSNLVGKRILVTGGAGFLGNNVVELLAKRGVKENHLVVPRSSDFDLTDIGATRELFKRYEPELVIHLAAKLGGIGDARTFPASYFRDNFLIGMNVIEACIETDVEKLVNIGTVCSYPKFTPAPFREEDLWNGFPEETNAPYGIAKKALMAYAKAARDQYSLNSVNLLLTNLYGPGDDFRDQTSHVIPAIIKKVVKAKEESVGVIEAWGDGSPSRDFVYVRDAAEAIILAAEHHGDCAPVNIGSGVEITIKNLIKMISQIVGYEGAVSWDISKPNGQPRRLLDISKARSFFGFNPDTSFERGLTKTINWYMKNRKYIDTLPPKFHAA